jgi:hypothetical protein
VPLNLNELDTKSSDYLEELQAHYRALRRGVSRYDLKRCDDALKAVRQALRRRRQGITSEPE